MSEWSNLPPVYDGWYWVKDSNGSVSVHYFMKHNRVMTIVNNEIGFIPVYIMKGFLFAGPLDQPR